MEAFLILAMAVGLETGSLDKSESSSVKPLINVFTFEELERLPLKRNLTAIEMLMPGAVKGDSAFGDLVSYDGASVAENAYFINGLNVTNPLNGLGHSIIPFEFIERVEVQTGGISADVGPALGGVVNVVTKSGTNDWQYGASVHYTPDTLRSTSPNVIDPRSNSNRNYLVNNAQDAYEQMEGNIFVSGPIIKDKLFIYVLYNPVDIQQSNLEVTFKKSELSEAYWAAKLDWNITEQHKIAVTGFSDKRNSQSKRYNWDEPNQQYVQPTISLSAENEMRGGDNYIVQYEGMFDNAIGLTASAGRHQVNATNSTFAGENCPVIIDVRTEFARLGCWITGLPSSSQGARDSANIVASYQFGRHGLKFGYEKEVATATGKKHYSGHIYYRYIAVAAGERFRGVYFPDAQDVVRVRVYETGGDYEIHNDAYFIQDTWTISNQLKAEIGVRVESFKNYSTNQRPQRLFMDSENNVAPRIQINWDVDGTGDSTISASVNRAHVPFSMQNNMLYANDELFTEGYYILGGINSDGTPQILYDHPISDEYLCSTSCGYLPSFRELFVDSIKPMSQDKFNLSVHHELSDLWQVGINASYSKVSRIVEDFTLNQGLESRWGAKRYREYRIGNPGEDTTVWADINDNGQLDKDENIHLSKSSLGYPTPKRTYTALTLTAARQWDEVWSVDASYVWSESKGNTEGLVKSDSGEDEAGVTTDWDFPALMDGAEGYLPNDRTHQLKVYGAYQFSEAWRIGANFRYSSGRPINKFGRSYPQDSEWAEEGYGQTYYLANGEFNPRGSAGRTGDVFELDLNATYEASFKGAEIALALDVFNVFDFDAALEVEENAETKINGSTNPLYGLPTRFQAPRSVRLSASVRF